MAWSLEQRQKCPRCGTFEWQHPNEGKDSHMEADVFVCFGCEKIDTVQERNKDEPTRHGLRYGLFPKED